MTDKSPAPPAPSGARGDEPTDDDKEMTRQAIKYFEDRGGDNYIPISFVLGVLRERLAASPTQETRPGFGEFASAARLIRRADGDRDHDNTSDLTVGATLTVADVLDRADAMERSAASRPAPQAQVSDRG